MAENGGKREGAGRKPKADELKLIEQLDAILAPESLWASIATLIESNKDIQAMKLWVQYRYGMPKQIVDNNVNLINNTPIAQDELNQAKQTFENEL